MTSHVDTESAFYGRLLVLSGLHSLDRNRYHYIERRRGPPLPLLNDTTNLTMSARQDLADDHKFRVFLDCLAEICASTRNGRTVTAVTVHVPNSKPQYLFVSNNRRFEDRNAARVYVTRILKALGNAQDYSTIGNRQVVPGVGRLVLKQALEFNRERFQVYVRVIYNCLDKLWCRDLDIDSNLACKTPATDLLKRIEKVLPWEDLKKAHDSRWIKNGKLFVKLTLDFMRKLEIDRSLRADGIFASLDILLANCTRVDKTDYLGLWHEFQHSLKRILSLQDSLGVIAATARDWPQLFRGVNIKFLPSEDLEAYELKTFYHLDGFLQPLGLDEETHQNALFTHDLAGELNKCIQGDPDKENIRMIHAEVQLWSHITKNLPQFVPFHPARLRTSDNTKTTMVIGVSKLTCRLCHWFFQGVHSHRVVMRPSSWNVYHRWALPSLPQDPGVIEKLDDELGHELSRVLAGGDVKRTETDTDSQPNSAALPIFTGPSSYASSYVDSSGVCSLVGSSTSSIECETEVEKAD